MFSMNAVVLELMVMLGEGRGEREIERERDISRGFSMDLDGAVWHGNANCLTHFCEQVCDASTVTVIDQTSPTCVPGCFSSK